MLEPSSLIIGLAVTAAAAYGLASLRVRKHMQAQPPAGKTPIALGALAVLLHGLALLKTGYSNGGLSSSFFDALSLTALIVVVATMISQFSQRILTLLVPVYIFAGVCVIAAALFGHHSPINASSTGMHIHIVSSIVAYSVLFVAALHALVLYTAEKSLRSGASRPWLQALPPLQTLEDHLFHLIVLGWAIVSLAIVSGALYVDNLLAQDLLHKTIFSLLSWLLLTALLLGRKLYGWRGRTAARWTVGAFVALLLGYMGSKFMLDIVLNRL